MTDIISGIDTMVLIYAGIVPAKEGTAVDRDLQLRAKLLLRMLEGKGRQIVLPAIAVAELLVPIPTTKHGKFLAALQAHFVCVPFDVKAASIAADLFAAHSRLDRTEQYASRTVLKADVMIIAAAKAAGATAFYSHERPCRTLASRIMTAKDLPTKDPDDMFAMSELKRDDSA